MFKYSLKSLNSFNQTTFGNRMLLFSENSHKERIIEVHRGFREAVLFSRREEWIEFSHGFCVSWLAMVRLSDSSRFPTPRCFSTGSNCLYNTTKTYKQVKLRKVLSDDGGSGGGSSRRRLFLIAAADRLATSGYASRKGYRRKFTRTKGTVCSLRALVTTNPLELSDLTHAH